MRNLSDFNSHDAFVIETISRVCYQTIREYLNSLNTSGMSNSWEDAGIWERDVMHFLVGYCLNVIKPNAKSLHGEFVRFMNDAGWVYGVCINVIEKTHPGLVGFDRLSNFSRAQYHILIRLVDALNFEFEV